MEMDDDEGCVAMSVYLMSLNCTLKMVRFMSRIFYHTHIHTHTKLLPLQKLIWKMNNVTEKDKTFFFFKSRDKLPASSSRSRLRTTTLSPLKG